MASQRPSLAETAVSATVADMNAVQAVYQPIVELATGTVVGFEALARWPGVGPVDPEDVFAAAKAAGVASEIEWACRGAAARGALDAGLGSETILFVNLESDLGPRAWPPPDSMTALIAEASERLRVVLEITERGLLSDPAELMSVVGSARRDGIGIAVDDVGANPRTLALLPFVDPDIVKLDRSLIQERLSANQARVLEFTLEHVERSGAQVIAEGIETERHLEQAISLGAHFGQGYLLGRPAGLDGFRAARLDPATSPTSTTSIEFRLDPTTPPVPSDLFARSSPRAARAELLHSLSSVIEDRALAASEPLSVLAAFGNPDRYTEAVAARYDQLAGIHPFVAVLGGRMLGGSATVRSVTFGPDDPFTDEWTLVLIGPHTAVALIARELHTDVDRGQRFEFLLTHDRDLVVAAGRSLMSRIRPT